MCPCDWPGVAGGALAPKKKKTQPATHPKSPARDGDRWPLNRRKEMLTPWMCDNSCGQNKARQIPPGRFPLPFFFQKKRENHVAFTCLFFSLL